MRSARAAFMGPGKGSHLNGRCSHASGLGNPSRIYVAFTLNIPVPHIASPAASEGSCGQEAQRKGKPRPTSGVAGSRVRFESPQSGLSTLSPHGPQHIHLRDVLGHIQPEGMRRRESGSETGPQEPPNNSQGSYISTSYYPPPPMTSLSTMLSLAPSWPQQLPAKAGQNQKERVLGRGLHAVAEASLGWLGPLWGSFPSRQLCAVLNVSDGGPRAGSQQGQMKGKDSA